MHPTTKETIRQLLREDYLYPIQADIAYTEHQRSLQTHHRVTELTNEEMDEKLKEFRKSEKEMLFLIEDLMNDGKEIN